MGKRPEERLTIHILCVIRRCRNRKGTKKEQQQQQQGVVEEEKKREAAVRSNEDKTSTASTLKEQEHKVKHKKVLT